MTAVAAIKVNGGLVLAVDGRITSGATICSEIVPKWIIQGPLVAAFAGDLGAIQATQRLWQVEEPGDIESCCALAPGKGDAWECVVYDRFTRQLASMDSDGALVACDPFAIAGSGQDVLYGFLRAQIRIPQDARTARHLLRDALSVTSERDATVGPDHHMVTVRRKGKPEIRHYRQGKYVEWLNSAAEDRKNRASDFNGR